MGHYSKSQQPLKLKSWAESHAQAISERIKGTTVHPVLFYRGMSGVASATALSIELSNLGILCDMLYVRKPCEDSHGNAVESHITGPDSSERLPVFVDDFVCSGATLADCVEAVINRFEILGTKLTTGNLILSLSGHATEDQHTSIKTLECGYISPHALRKVRAVLGGDNVHTQC